MLFWQYGGNRVPELVEERMAMTEIISSDDELDAVLTDYGFTTTVTGRPGLYRFSCSCGYGAALIATRNPAFALRIAEGHLNTHKPADDSADPFEGMS